MMIFSSSNNSSTFPTQQPPPLLASSGNHCDNNVGPVPFPLFLPQPMTGISFWETVLLGAAKHREAAIRETHAEVKQMKNLNKQIEKAYQDRKRRNEMIDQTKNATHTRIGKLMAKAIDKSWVRAKRGYEAKISLAVEIEKQQHAEKRQASFLKDTERLTSFLAESFRSLASTNNNNNNSNTKNEDDANSMMMTVNDNNNNNNGIPPLSLLNTLNGARPLRPYQREALAFFINLYNNGLNGLCGLEMGLGKSVLTLSLLAYFAEHKNDWGPHLIVVPASILANWELECMRWTPGFKVIKYHGSAKEREKLRKGWTTNEGAFHICLASYSTVVHDRNIFKRRGWGFLILDEAHNIKNWKSQNWQVLFELQSSYRLLLTGTPLQTSVMELWALLRFIVPPQVAIQAAKKHLHQNNNNKNDDDKGDDDDVGLAAAFDNMEDFQRWFSDPLTAMVQGQATFDSTVVLRLQALLRPFFFRRVKSEVESQLPPKKEVVVLCPLSKRQGQLYHEFLSLASTKETLAVGSYFGVVRVLLSLRKVCNHPDLFAERPVASPLCLDPYYDRLRVRVPRRIFLNDLGDDDDTNNFHGGGRNKRKRNSVENNSLNRFCSSTLENLWNLTSHLKYHPDKNKQLHLYVQDLNLATTVNSNANKLQPDGAISNNKKKAKAKKCATTNGTSSTSSSFEEFLRKDIQNQCALQDQQTSNFLLRFVKRTSKNNNNCDDDDNDDIVHSTSQEQEERVTRMVKMNNNNIQQNLINKIGFFLPATWCCQVNVSERILGKYGDENALVYKYLLVPTAAQRIEGCAETLRHFVFVVPRVWARLPMLTCALPLRLLADPKLSHQCLTEHVGYLHYQSTNKNNNRHFISTSSSPLQVCDPHDVFFAAVQKMRLQQPQQHQGSIALPADRIRNFEPGWPLLSHYFHFPETRWVVQDCGKFFVLLPLFKKLAAEGHRVLIFTQFTGMLSILERFLAFMGLPYLRLDSTISPDERQFRVEQFNRDARIFAMVLSTRAGGIGLNLIGADTVVFFDSDWNPAMDLQAQDRCHRIGQTRAVTIYRCISEHTVEVNIVKKARQRKILNNLVIRSGQFHAGGFQEMTNNNSVEDCDDGGGTNNNNNNSENTNMNHNFMTRETLLNFFHDRDDDSVAENEVLNFSSSSTVKSNSNNDEMDWNKATAAAEDAEDRAAGSAAAAEQKTAEAADWLESQGEVAFSVGIASDNASNHDFTELLMSSTSGNANNSGGNPQRQQQQQHYVKRNFAATSGLWPPPFHKDEGVEQRLQIAVRNATNNNSIEVWAANTLPFFDKNSANGIRAKVRSK